METPEETEAEKPQQDQWAECLGQSHHKWHSRNFKYIKDTCSLHSWWSSYLFWWNVCLGAILNFGRGGTGQDRAKKRWRGGEQGEILHLGKISPLPSPSSRLWEDCQLCRLCKRQLFILPVWSNFMLLRNFHDLLSDFLLHWLLKHIFHRLTTQTQRLCTKRRYWTQKICQFLF